ncbi:hypothetical protein QAD02_000249 [Eretmocerus hayati]|uniref:Uncharacterized protein n=1 Tax=Eretmocerus hayati TaxID=131215 RepID=A0ACC2NCV5_9HYME|nr:hypothetical protein QAD02_000249 [Eretmocerus hayati]
MSKEDEAKEAFKAFKEALEADDFESVQRIIKESNTGEQEHHTSSLKSMLYRHFIYSIYEGNIKTVNLTLRVGVDRSYINSWHSGSLGGPLMNAIRIKDKSVRWKMFKLLLDHRVGLKVDSPSPRLHQQECVHQAVIEGDCEMVKYLVENLDGQVNYLRHKNMPNSEFAPIHEAVMCSVKCLETEECLKMIKQLVDLGADVNIRTKHRATCLHLVAGRCSGRCEVTKLLVDLGADVNAIVPEDPYYLPPPIVMACSHNDCELVKLMIDLGAEVNQPKYWRNSGLFCAVTERRKEVMKLLLEHGADVDAKDTDGDNILFRATVKLWRCKIDYSEYVDCLKILASYSSNINPTEDEYYVPFKNVLTFGNMEAMQLFFENGVTLKNCGVRFPLHQAASNSQVEILEYLLKSRLYDVDKIDNEGKTALDIAVSKRLVECVRLLLEWGADVNTTTGLSDNVTFVSPLISPLIDALIQGEDAIADLLLSAGANFDLEDLINRKFVQLRRLNRHESWKLYILDKMGQEELIDYSYSRIKTGLIFTKQSLLQQSERGKVNVKVKNLLTKINTDYTKNANQCSAELADLKKSLFYGTVTLYDLLLGKDVSKFTINDQVMKNFESLRVVERFPMYGYRINCIYLLACVNGKVTDGAIRSLNKLTESRFCLEILQQIMLNLKKQDLRNLCYIYRNSHI